MIAFARLLAEKPGLLTCRERHTVIKARYFMRKEEHTRLMRELNGMLRASTAPSFEGIKVYVSGVMLEPSHILDVMDELGYTIVGDELAHESRQFNHLVPEALSQLERLARQVQTYEGEAFLYDPRKTRGERVARAAKEAGADAVLFALMKFCDTDEYDLPWVRCAAQEADLPFLHLELEQTMQSAEPLRSPLGPAPRPTNWRWRPFIGIPGCPHLTVCEPSPQDMAGLFFAEPTHRSVKSPAMPRGSTTFSRRRARLLMWEDRI